MADKPKQERHARRFRYLGVDGSRRWIEMLGALHRLGYGRLRLACSWEEAAQYAVWFGTIAPRRYFRADHGAILARDPCPEKPVFFPNDWPMFSSRRFAGQTDYPWPGFRDNSPDQAAKEWLSHYPRLAVEGMGEDEAYAHWFARMLEATAPSGLIGAYHCHRGDPPDFMLVEHHVPDDWIQHGQFSLPPLPNLDRDELD